MPKTPAAWAELARLFREASGRFPELRHILIELPERIPEWTEPRKVGDCPAPRLSFRLRNLLGLPTTWAPIVDFLESTDDEQRSRTAILARLQPALVLAASIHDSVRLEPFFAILSRHEFGQEQVFYGDAGGRRAPGWQQFVKLARVGVELASETGVITPTPSPDSIFEDVEAYHWAGTWMNLVYRLARERSPDSLLRVQETARWDGRRLPDGMKVASLLVGVFDASAYAADRLAEGDQAREAPAPETPAVKTDLTEARERRGEAPAEIPDLVTLDQIAASVHRTKRALEHYKTKETLPNPTVEGGGGRPALWDWKAIRPWLETQFGMKLPETYPANRRHA